MHISYWVKTIIEIYVALLVIGLAVGVPAFLLDKFFDALFTRPKRSIDY